MESFWDEGSCPRLPPCHLTSAIASTATNEVASHQAHELRGRRGSVTCPRTRSLAERCRLGPGPWPCSLESSTFHTKPG